MSALNFKNTFLSVNIERAALLKSENMTAFDIKTGLTLPRITKCYEVILFTEDGGYFVVDGIKYDIKRGVVRFLRPGQTVYSKKYGDAYVLYFSYDHNEINTLSQMPSSLTCTDYNVAERLYKDIITSYLSNERCSELVLYHSLLELLCLFYYDSQKSKASHHTSEKVRSVYKAAKFLEENYMNHISLEDVSKEVGLHPNYLHRIFKQIMHKTPLEYLLKIRIDKATDYLLITSLSILEISQMCGFDSSSYFISVFKKYCGVTPSKFRANNTSDGLL